MYEAVAAPVPIMKIRKVIFWIHLPIGVIAGLVIFIMSVTGVLLSYEKQITSWADTRNYRIEPAPGAQRLPLETLIEQIRKNGAEVAPSTITTHADPAKPLAASLGRDKTVFINPYTGEILGEGSKVRAFFRSVTDLHRWLGSSGESRAMFRSVTGICNLGFLLLVVSGLYLWWPRKRQWEQIRSLVWFRGGLSGKARDFNWHTVIGFWLCVPLFIVVFSAIPISCQWAGNMIYRLVGETPPASQGLRAAGAQQSGGSPRSVEDDQGQAGKARVRLDEMLSRAQEQLPDWKSISLRLPTPNDTSVVFTIDQGDGGQPQSRAQLTLNRITGEVERWEPFSSYSTGRKLRSFLRFAHTGEVAGSTGQLIAAGASAGAAMLVFTGLALSWRRFRSWIKRSNKSIIHSPAVVGELNRRIAQADEPNTSESGGD